MKNALHVTVVVIVGSLLGLFISKLLGIWFPAGSQLAALMNTGINTGLNPTTVDLNLVEVTAGLVFKFNISSVAGIFLAAVVYKQLVK
ncbi:MAG: hypothetical protein COX65_03400 [Elusimicrobia bacterium CG_4_10_14_0_2_um_filter_56_8]|nr:MAG: hypothetical protein AUJ51_05150 [Elusimicrobia bacterium CG1_02_56_21]PJA16022.1 MAG: hypothetical protein COX65_03400 [Elusimicrobia bacterium CG_4_10_14_0_2_um_filter_56_8]